MIFLRFLIWLTLAIALPVGKVERRDVVSTSTEKIGWAQLFAGTTTTATPAVTTAAATTTSIAAATTSATTSATTTSSSGGLLSSLLSLFGSSKSSSTTATTTSATATATATTATSTSTASSWLSSLLSLFGSGSSSSSTTVATTAATTTAATAATATAATATAVTSSTSSKRTTTTTTSESPGFTGLVTVEGAGSEASGTGSAADSTESGTASSSDISEVAQYAELGIGITYSPYTKSGSCKSASQVASDIEMLSGYKLIRLYSVDCSGISNVLAAMTSSQQLYLGVWDITAVSTDLPSMAEQVEGSSRGWSAVHTVAIGNEVVNSGRGTVAEVSAAVSTARTWFKNNASSYTGYIVTVDTLVAVMANTAMCTISDYIAVNCHPYFSAIDAADSGTWLKEQVASLKSTCNNDLDILVTESGWPTGGNTLGEAVPSVANQLSAIKSLGQVMGDQVIMFTTYNDYWKDPGSYNVEQKWGIYGDPEY